MTRLITWCACLVLGLCAVTGCRPSPSPSATTPPAPPADRSQAIAYYIERGVPAADRPWSGKDMQDAAAMIAALALESPDSLPRSQSARSGELFARMTSGNNLDLYRNTSLPLESRMSDAVEYQAGLNAIMKVYIAKVGLAVGGREPIELFGHMLEVMATITPMTNEFASSLDTSDPTYEVRLDGLRKMKAGYATAVSGALITLTESNVFTAGERGRFAISCERSFPTLFRFMPEHSATEFRRKLAAMAVDPSLKDTASEIAAVAKALSVPPSK